MKIRFTIILFLLTVFSACDKQLDLAPENTLVEKDVFKSDAGADQALAEGYYSLMQAVTGSIAYMFGDFTTANLKHSSFYDSYDRGEITPADESVLSVWTAYFKAINMANNLISNIPLYGDFDPVK